MGSEAKPAGVFRETEISEWPVRDHACVRMSQRLSSAGPRSGVEPPTPTEYETAPFPPGAGRLVCQLAGDRTVVSRAAACGPLKILTPRNHGKSAWCYLSTLGGGLVGGDRIALDLDVRDRAVAFVGTQGANRVYRAERLSESCLRGNVRAGALLVWIPDATTCFAHAKYSQTTEIHLARTSSLVYCDMMSSGRVANAERWAFDRYEARTTIVRDGETVFLDRWLLDPTHGTLVERFGAFNAIATVVVVGELPVQGLLQRVSSEEVNPGSPMVVSGAALRSDVLVLRFAATDIERLVNCVRSYLAFVPALLGDDPWARRA